MPRDAASKGTVVVVDDDPDIQDLAELWLSEAGYGVERFMDGQSFLKGMARLLPDAVLLDLNMPGLSGGDTMERLRRHHRYLPVIVITANTQVDSVVSMMQRGAYDYLVKPLDADKLRTTVRNAVERYRMALKLAHLEREAEGDGYGGIIGNSSAMRRLFRQMDRVGVSDITVLIHGESGTGKELVARAIHQSSGRSDGPYVTLNCAAIPESLQESELFGHEKGAFTGADARRIGRFEQADGGTMFLDEVAELSPALQAKLLRVLQEKRVSRVGGTSEIASDFRLVAATHRHLTEEVEAGRFREDLFFRIAVLELDIPPLRDRETDVLLLAHTFLAELAQQHGGRSPSLDERARETMLEYSWPGNVRELQNAMHRAYVLCNGDVIQISDLPARILRGDAPTTTSDSAPTGEQAPPAPAQSVTPDLGSRSLDDLERQAIVDALERHKWNISEVGRQLGIGRTTLYRKLKKYGIK